MGTDFFDFWSIGHFLGGIVGRMAVFPNNALYSFVVSNGIHFFVEIIEKNPHPVTGGVETNRNHAGDIFFFLVGWIVADVWLNQYMPDKLRTILLIIFIIFVTKEIIRELEPRL